MDNSIVPRAVLHERVALHIQHSWHSNQHAAQTLLVPTEGEPCAFFSAASSTFASASLVSQEANQSSAWAPPSTCHLQCLWHATFIDRLHIKHNHQQHSLDSCSHRLEKLHLRSAYLEVLQAKPETGHSGSVQCLTPSALGTIAKRTRRNTVI